MTREEKQKAIYVLKNSAPVFPLKKPEEYNDCVQAIKQVIDWLEQEPSNDCISRKSIKQKLQEHHDFFVNAYGGFSNLPQNDKSRVDEITNCIAMVVNEPPVTSQEPRWISVSEKLPEANKAVLTYVDTGVTKTYCLADWNGNCIGWEEWIGTRLIEKEMGYKVLAWMPLPGSYKAESEKK